MFDLIVYFGSFFYFITFVCIISSDELTVPSYSQNYETPFIFKEIHSVADSSEAQSPTQHAAIQIIILSATIILIIFVSVLLCNICCKHYRFLDHLKTRTSAVYCTGLPYTLQMFFQIPWSPDNPFFGRASSVTSIQELIRERLQDRPPSYHESQNSLATCHHEDPPPYHEIASNATNQTVTTISSKILPNVNEHSVGVTLTGYDSPPSYHTSECTLNTVFLVTSSIPLDNNRNNFEVEPEHGSTIFNNVMYI